MRAGIPTEIKAYEDRVAHPTRALIHLDRLTHNLRLLQELAGERPMWPVIKANAYGHGATIVARHLVALDYKTLCVAHASEAVELRKAGVDATFLLLSPALREESELIVEHGLEPVVCTRELVDFLSQAAQRIGRPATVHVKVDTGMGRVGIPPHDVVPFLEHCQKLSGLRVRGIMSHFPRADEADKSFSREQIATFRRVQEQTAGFGIDVYHLANSAGILDLPDSGFDAVRPGICRAYRCAWLDGAFEDGDRPDRLGAVLDLQSRGDSVRLVVRQMDGGALARSPRLQEIVSQVRCSMPVEIRDVDDVLDPDHPYRVLQPDGDDIEIEGDRVRVHRKGQLLYERRAPWLERTVRAIQQRVHAWRLGRWPSHEERVTLLGLGKREDS